MRTTPLSKLYPYIFILVLSLSGCASIPLGTMVKFSSFDEQQLLVMQPRDIRARIQIEEPAKLNVETAELTLTLQTEQGELFYEYPLTLIAKTRIAPVEGFFTSRPGQTEYTLKLSDLARENFKAAQQELARQQPKGFSFSVSANFDDFPEDRTEITFSIALQLDPTEGYFNLFEDATMEINYPDEPS